MARLDPARLLSSLLDHFVQAERPAVGGLLFNFHLPGLHPPEHQLPLMDVEGFDSNQWARGVRRMKCAAEKSAETHNPDKGPPSGAPTKRKKHASQP